MVFQTVYMTIQNAQSVSGFVYGQFGSQRLFQTLQDRERTIMPSTGRIRRVMTHLVTAPTSTGNLTCRLRKNGSLMTPNATVTMDNTNSDGDDVEIPFTSLGVDTEFVEGDEFALEMFHNGVGVTVQYHVSVVLEFDL